jgi:6-phosphogluconolactonase/glucosamine-6-phosphate isomerase/deaminase
LYQVTSTTSFYVSQEKSEKRKENHNVLFAISGGESMSIMYGTLLRKYEAVKDDYGLISQR